jgi:hypothetical protein
VADYRLGIDFGTSTTVACYLPAGNTGDDPDAAFLTWS